MKIYYAKSKQVSDKQAQKELEFLKDTFKDSSIIYYKDGPYDPVSLDSADVLIVTSTNYKFLVGRGIANQVVSTENAGKPIYLLDKNGEEELVLRLYDGYDIVDHKTWQDGYVRIHPREIIDINKIFENGQYK